MTSGPQAMQADTLQVFELNGARLRYLDKGSGPILLLIHGLGASHTDWQKQIDFFARVFRVIVPDLRGHGDSDAEGPFNVERFALDCSCLLDELKVGSFFLVGHSMGGAVAMQLALFKPDRVTKLVLADTLPSFKADTSRKQLLLWTRLLIMHLLGAKALARRTAQQMFPKPEQAELRELIIQRSPHTSKATYLALLKSLARWSVADRLNWLVMPVFVVAGEHDYFPPEEAQSFADRLPDGHCRIIEGAHHHLPLEMPEDFNRITLQFLMPGSQIATSKADAGLNWLRMDPAAQKRIDLEALLKKPK